MRTPPRGPWPAGLLGLLVLVAGVERFIERHEASFTTHRVAAWKRSGGRVSEASRCAVVGFGDSLVKHGFVPAALEARAGRSAYNLAVPAGLSPGDYFLFHRLLRSGARPAAVLVDGEALSDRPTDRVRVWPEIATLGECADLAWAERDAAFFGRMALAKALPSYRAHAEIRAGVMAALAGTALDEPRSLAALWRNWNKNGGAHVLPPFDLSKGDTRPGVLQAADYRPPRWDCHPVNAAYVARFLDLADGHGVPVFWLLPPYHPEVEARRAGCDWYGRYVPFLHGLQARHPRLTVVDGRHAGYPPEALADMTHLSRTGAVAFSDAVAAVVRDRLASGASPSAPRWVEVPRYDAARAEALASALPVEDVDRSGREVRRAAGRRRPGGGPYRVGQARDAAGGRARR